MGSEVLRQAIAAGKTLMCYLGKHDQCVHSWACHCRCHLRQDVRHGDR